MARGASAANQLNTTNQVAGQEGANANAIQSQLTPAYTSLMNTGYFTPQEQSAATTNEMGAATAPFQAANFQANNQAAATNNAASLPAEQTQLALQEGQVANQAAGNLQQQQMQGQEAGAYGLGQLGAQDTQAMESMYGLGPGTLNAQANLSNASWGPLNSLISAGGSAAAAQLGKGG